MKSFPKFGLVLLIAFWGGSGVADTWDVGLDPNYLDEPIPVLSQIPSRTEVDDPFSATEEYWEVMDRNHYECNGCQCLSDCGPAGRQVYKLKR